MLGGLFMNMTKLIALVFILIGFGLTATRQIASGGPYSLDQSVIASGGGDATGGSYAIIGTSGQSTAGTFSTAGGYGVRGGFWQGTLFPTAAPVSVRGRVLTAQ